MQSVFEVPNQFLMAQAEGDINYNMCDFMVACHCSSLRAVSEPAKRT